MGSSPSAVGGAGSGLSGAVGVGAGGSASGVGGFSAAAEGEVTLKATPSGLGTTFAVGTASVPVTITRILLGFCCTTSTEVMPGVGFS